MLEWNKGKADSHVTQADYIQGMEAEMGRICENLSIETKSFEPKAFYEKMHTYITQNDRLLYTYITNYIFSLENDEKFEIMQTNIDNVVNYMYGEQYKQDFRELLLDENKKRECERTQRTVLKLWDHINLARRQYLMFGQSDEEYEKIVDKKMEMAGTKISKEMNTQLISLVSIFTALSFLVFGGISSLNNIFSGVKDIPTLKLIIVGCVWSFCIMNLVFVFMFFVAGLTKLPITSTEDINANIVKKYPLIWWSNFVILSILCLSCWIYYIRRYGYSNRIDNYISDNPTAFAVVGIVIIVMIMLVIAKKIYKMWKS